MDNPFQTIMQVKNFMSNYKGADPRAEAMQQIQQCGINQSELNELQKQATDILSMCQQFGLFK